MANKTYVDGDFLVDGELSIKVYSQDSEPTLDTDEKLAIWKDTNDSDKIYFIFRRGSGDQVKLEWTATGGVASHDLGGSAHLVDTLANLNSKVSDATLDDSSDPRDPNSHDLAGSEHSVDTLANLNSKISDATLDDSSDTRVPSAHDLAGSEHSADTLANLNSKISDATLDDSSDTRVPSAHALAGSEHSADTLANLNSKVSDATLDDSSDTRVPSAHNLGGSKHSVDTLANLNSKISDATLDDSSDTRVPSAHNLGGSEHSVDTLANLNTKISDATLDDSSDTRVPSAHNLGGSEHSVDTLANLNTKISDATLDDSSDPRDPNSHKDSHDPEDGSDALDTANAAEISTVVAAGTGSAHSFARSDHIHAINHSIADNHIVTIDGTIVDNDYAKFTSNGLEGRNYAEVRSDLDLVIERMQFFADMFNSPNNADWAVNALAPLAADTNDAGLLVRLFDDTSEEGVGWSTFIPTGSTDVKLTFVSRPETAPGAARIVGLTLYERGVVGGVDAWSAGTTLTNIDITTNENWLYDTQTISLATLGVTTGQIHQFELTRDPTPSGGTDLTGDWTLFMLMMEFI